ncbi:MAG: hypothetical protein IPK82_39455 [Polyangiaceae bacterium]|nr:hypothetical protein [Polyangiaceae bacterium]
MQFGKRTRVLIGASALFLGASVALADDPVTFPECTKPPLPEDTEAAKQSHLIATSRFNLGDWDKALEFWKQAYTLDCTAHGLLVNVANAYEKKGDKKNAIAALEAYLVRAKDAPDLVKVNDRIIEMKKSMEPVPTATATATATATVSAAPTTTATAPTGPRPYGSLPFIIAGAGAALAVAGVIMIPVGLGPYNTAADACPGADCTDEVAAAGNSGRITWNAGAALLGIGLAAAGGGLVFHFVANQPKPAASAPGPKAPTPPAKAQVRVTPVASDRYGGFIVSGQF